MFKDFRESHVRLFKAVSDPAKFNSAPEVLDAMFYDYKDEDIPNVFYESLVSYREAKRKIEEREYQEYLSYSEEDNQMYGKADENNNINRIFASMTIDEQK